MRQIGKNEYFYAMLFNLPKPMSVSFKVFCGENSLRPKTWLRFCWQVPSLNRGQWSSLVGSGSWWLPGVGESGGAVENGMCTECRNRCGRNRGAGCVH